MDTNLLRSWLGLPPGPWPPGDRELLRLGDGRIDSATAERRALELMGALRPHQLKHPELVTEGMNRLAQAMLAVTMFAPSPASPARAEATRPQPARPASTVATPQIVPVDLAPVAPPPPPDIPKPVSQPAAEVLEAEPIELDEPTVVVPPEVPIVRRAPVERPLPPIPEVEPIELSKPIVGNKRSQRRKAYREIVGLRGLLRAWDRLRPSMADPSEPLATPAHVFDFLEGITDARHACEHPGLPEGIVSDVAPLVDAHIRQALPLAVFRSLTMHQRQRLARDWTVGRSTFEKRYQTYRRILAATKPEASTKLSDRLIYVTGHYPEWMMVAVSVVFIGFAIVRVVLK